MDEQPQPVEAEQQGATPSCLEVGDASGRPFVNLLMPELTVEDAIFRVLPHVRTQIRGGGPLWFKLRDLTPEETKALAAAQR
jgi:hypothetical protein